MSSVPTPPAGLTVVRLRRAALAATAVGALLAGLLAGESAGVAATGDGSPTDSNVKYFGRWDYSNSAAPSAKWAGAYVKVGFTGTTVKLRQRNSIDLWASIDGGPDVAYTNVSGTVNLTSRALAAGNHTLRVSYRAIAGSYTGDAVFQGLVLDPGAHTNPATVGSKLIEFVGDSITVGQLTSKLSLTSYAWLTGEQLAAEHTQIAQGGACLVNTSDGCVGLSVQFVRTSALASSANWDFSRYRADAVVINLGTNDVGHSVHTPEYQSTYTSFLRTVRSKYPNAVIFAMSNFKQRFAAQTQAAVAAVGDSNIVYVDTVGWIDSTADTVDGTHPNDAGHQKITARLAPIIKARLASGTTTTTTTTATTTTATTTTTSAATSSTTSPTSTTSTTSSTTVGTNGSCPVRYTLTGQWPGGFQADVTITNTSSSTLNGWTVTWTFPGTEKIASGWNAALSQSGAAVTATNASYNGTVAPGGTASFGFTGTDSGSASVPAGLALNGVAC